MTSSSDDERVSRFRRVKEMTDTIDEAETSEDQIEEDAAKWLDLAKAGTQLAVAAAKGDIGGVTENTTSLVRAMLDVEEAQARLLESIDENVKLLRDGPFKTGRLYLREAHRLVANPARSDEFVERAQEQFYQAHAMVTEPMDQAAVEMHIALAAILLGHPEDASHWLEQAYDKAAAQAIQLAEITGNTKVAKSFSRSAAIYLAGGGLFLAAKKISKTRANHRAQDGLRELLPVVGCISALHATSGAEAEELPVLELVKLKRNQYELVEISA